jgi:hypothetical protein
MYSKRKTDIFSWIALGMVITGAASLLIIAGAEIEYGTRNILFLLAWLWVVVPAFRLFKTATDKALKRAETALHDDIPVQQIPANKKSPGKKEHFDIQGIAGKIVRRVSPAGDPEALGNDLLRLLVSELEIMSGIFYYKKADQRFVSLNTYAYPHSTDPYSFAEGEGLTGQAVKNRQVSVYRSVPEEYTSVFSGLGSGKPSYLAIVPVVIGNIPVAVLEIAGFRWAEENLEQFFQIIARGLAEKMGEISREKNEKRTGNSSEKSGEDKQ